jgi:hypothetical protein
VYGKVKIFFTINDDAVLGTALSGLRSLSKAIAHEHAHTAILLSIYRIQQPNLLAYASNGAQFVAKQPSTEKERER